MRMVLIYSMLLIAGLIASQFLPQEAWLAAAVKAPTMLALSFIMINVGREFSLDKSNPGKYAWDYVVAFTAAGLPWVFCSLYFVYVMAPDELWTHGDLWKETLLTGRFASPTSAGVLFAMLAAAGLSATWLFKKARILAILDDVDTILLMLPLQMLLVGLQPQLLLIVVVLVCLLWLGWRYLHVVRLPMTWHWILAYAALITLASEAVYFISSSLAPEAPVHLEVLLPAFVLGCMLAHPPGHGIEGHIFSPAEERAHAREEKVSRIVSACFMVFVGLSMPLIKTDSAIPLPPADVATAQVHAAAETPAPGDLVPPSVNHHFLKYEGADPSALQKLEQFPGWGMIALHVAAVTFLSNLGKMFPAICYRREAGLRQRLALAVGMWPRGEVGAGVLAISISYGIGGAILTVAILSLALNLLLTGVFILGIKRLLRSEDFLLEGDTPTTDQEADAL